MSISKKKKEKLVPAKYWVRASQKKNVEVDAKRFGVTASEIVREELTNGGY